MDAKTRWRDFADGQANTVDANKSFVQDIFHQLTILDFKPDLAIILAPHIPVAHEALPRLVREYNKGHC